MLSFSAMLHQVHCARHPEDVHKEQEEICRYKHRSNHCPLAGLYLAQLQNQHRWRADANTDQLKHGDLGHVSLQWNTIGPVKPYWAAVCTIILSAFDVYIGYMLKILVWKASLRGWHQIISSAEQPLITHTLTTHSPEFTIFSLARSKFWNGQASFSLSHYKNRPATALPAPLEKTASG